MKKISTVLISFLMLTLLNCNSVLAINNHGVQPVDYESKRVKTTRARRDVLPSSYNSKDLNLVTSVKDQNPNGTCWAFSSVSSGESSMINKGYNTNSNIDLSERQLAYFFYHYVEDEYGYTSDDETNLIKETPSDTYLSIGGNNLLTTFKLANWVGLANESDAPYVASSNVSDSDLDDSLAYKDAAILKNASFFNNSDTDLIKQSIIDNGSVVAVYFSDNSFYKQANYQGVQHTFYHSIDSYNGSYNHAITIVGYDDNVDGSIFGSDIEDGAWIVKNSLGSSWGDDGYFYLSYDEPSLKQFIGYDFTKASDYDHNYHYDSGAYLDTIRIKSGDSIANSYTIQGTTNDYERIKAVSLALDSTNVNYSIQLYKDSSDSNPSDGLPLLDIPQTGSTTTCGYYTIDLDQSLTVKKGDKISVVITLDNNGNGIDVFTDTSDSYSFVSFKVNTDSKQCYYSSNGEFMDLNDSHKANRIKLLTSDDDNYVDIDAIELSDTSKEMKVGETFKLDSTVSPSDTTFSKSVKYTVDNDNVSIDKDGNVKALKSGQSVISVTASNGVISTCTVTIKEENIVTLTMSNNNFTFNVGDKYKLPVKLSNNEINALIYHSSNSSIVSVDSQGNILCLKPGAVDITVSYNNISTTCHIIVRNNKVTTVTSVETGDHTTIEVLGLMNVLSLLIYLSLKKNIQNN